MSLRGNAMLGHGVYTIPEVARYTRLPYARVRSWFIGQPSRGTAPIFTPDYPAVENSYAVSFYDMIDVLWTSKFRDLGFSFQFIRRAHQALKQELDTDHPFCHKELFTDGKALFVRLATEIEPESFHELFSKQQFFPNIIKSFLVEFDQETSLTNLWNIAKGVNISPAVSFGKPVVKDTGTTTYVISQWYSSNKEDAELVADLFNIGVDDVENAVTFEGTYGKAA